MGQKVNPTGLRIGVIKDWDSRWYASKKDFGDTLVSDNQLRNYLLETLAPAGVPKVEIERDAKRVRINIHCAKPGMVIGKGGAEIARCREHRFSAGAQSFVPPRTQTVHRQNYEAWRKRY